MPLPLSPLPAVDSPQALPRSSSPPSSGAAPSSSAPAALMGLILRRHPIPFRLRLLPPPAQDLRILRVPAACLGSAPGAAAARVSDVLVFLSTLSVDSTASFRTTRLPSQPSATSTAPLPRLPSRTPCPPSPRPRPLPPPGRPLPLPALPPFGRRVASQACEARRVGVTIRHADIRARPSNCAETLKACASQAARRPRARRPRSTSASSSAAQGRGRRRRPRAACRPVMRVTCRLVSSCVVCVSGKH
jgi:hypothetical protein